MLGTLENHRKSNWKKYIAPLLHAYNCTKHDSTGYTPHYLMFHHYLELLTCLTRENLQELISHIRQTIREELSLEIIPRLINIEKTIQEVSEMKETINNNRTRLDEQECNQV